MQRTLIVGVAMAVLGAMLGCQDDVTAHRESVEAYHNRAIEPADVDSEYTGEMEMVAETADETATAGRIAPQSAKKSSVVLPGQKALMAEAATANPPSAEEVLIEIPDPSEANEAFEKRFQAVKDTHYDIEPRVVDSYRRVIDQAKEYLDDFARQRQVKLSLADCIERALANNYSIESESYEPAIESTRLVEAEAAFDSIFFLDSSYQRSDDAAIVPTGGEQVDSRAMQGGIRKLLPTGMQVQVSAGVQRTMILKQRLPKKTNPGYGTSLQASFTQPLLRDFGLEVNRSQIEISKANRDASWFGYEREVRDRLLDVERAYWQLVQARRNVAILAESVAQNKVTADDMKQREFHDATPVEVANSKARYSTRHVELTESYRVAMDAEDALKNLMNDPSLLLSEDIEIIPTETPLAVAVTLDQLEQVRTALDSRSEVKEARRSIDALGIATNYAKNQTLPQLDLSFDYEVQGAGLSADSAFDQATENDHIAYAVSLQFSMPIGNRGPRAAHRRARLQESQAIVALKQLMDGIVQEVNSTVRTIVVRYAQLPPQLDSVKASERNLRSLQARTQAITPSFLETELSAVEQLSNSRSRLLQILIDYNVSLIQLERDKGTLLDYNNIELSDEPPME